MESVHDESVIEESEIVEGKSVRAICEKCDYMVQAVYKRVSIDGELKLVGCCEYCDSCCISIPE